MRCLYAVERRNRIMKNKGFTLIELVVVITILGLLAVVAAPRFLNLSSSARVATLEGIEGGLKSINLQVNAMNGLEYIQRRNSDACTGDPTNDPCRLTYFDENRNGIQEKSEGEFDMIWNYIDNTDLQDAITVEGNDTLIYYIGGGTDRANAYYGYDFDADSDVLDDNCYFEYTQAEGASIPPEYRIVQDGC